MRYAIVENGVVTNVIVADEEHAPSGAIEDDHDEAQIGGSWDGEAFSPAPPPVGLSASPAGPAKGNFRGRIRRQADALAQSGDTVGALLLLRKHGI